MDDFLEEQLERMRRLTERMSQVHSRVAQNSALISRDRDALHSGPLHQLRDLRTHQTHDYAISPREARRLAAANDRSTARERTPRRKRR